MTQQSVCELCAATWAALHVAPACPHDGAGAETVTVACLLTFPLPVQLSVYTVVLDSAPVLLLPLVATPPSVGLIEQLLALLEAHDNVELEPFETVDGDAEKLLIVVGGAVVPPPEVVPPGLEPVPDAPAPADKAEDPGVEDPEPEADGEVEFPDELLF